MSCQDNSNSNFGDDTLTPAYNMAKYSISKLYRDGGVHSQKNFISGYQKCIFDLLTMISKSCKHRQNFNSEPHRYQVSFKTLAEDFFEARGVSREEMASLLQSNVTNHPPPNHALNSSKLLFKQVQHPIHLEALKKNATQKYSTQNISKSVKRKKAKHLLAESDGSNVSLIIEDSTDDCELYSEEPRKVRRRREP